jgi:hypothetical protein
MEMLAAKDRESLLEVKIIIIDENSSLPLV